MTDTTTDIFDLSLPEVGGSDGSWGGKINANFSTIDALLSRTLRAENAPAPIPAVANRIGKALGFDANGDPIAITVGTDSDPSIRADLAASGGSQMVGFVQSGTGAGSQTVQGKLRSLPKTPDDFAGTDTQKLQAALNSRGTILLTRNYDVSTTLTIYGNTSLIGIKGVAKLTYSGAASGDVIRDSSLTTPTDVNLNIVLKDFEIDGNSLASGSSSQLGINFWRVGNITISGVTAHGFGGSGIRWGNSYTDTIGVLVENCTVYDCRVGDAIQGSGRKITVRNNIVGKTANDLGCNFGDTAIALIYDSSATTNPSSLFSSDVEISGNTITGNYNGSGTYVGTGGSAQTGIAFGPFGIGVKADIRVLNNKLQGCYVNLWGIVLEGLSVRGNSFGAHAAAATGGVRLDGVTKFSVTDNSFKLTYASTGAAYSAMIMFAQRNTYGMSVFDANVTDFEITDNRFTGQAGVTASAIRLSFAEADTSPSYSSKITDGVISNNHFRVFTTRVDFAPVSGTGNDLCDNVTVQDNVYDSTVGQFVAFAGTAGQYKDTRVERNTGPANVTVLSGVASYAISLWHKVKIKVNLASGSATTLYTLPTGYYVAQTEAKVLGNDEKWSSLLDVAVNESSRRDLSTANGSFLTLSRSVATIQATQSSGSAVDCYVSVILRG